MEPLYKGPNSIIEVNSNEYVTLQIKGKPKKVHKNLIAPFHLPENSDSESIENSSDDEQKCFIILKAVKLTMFDTKWMRDSKLFQTFITCQHYQLVVG